MPNEVPLGIGECGLGSLADRLLDTVFSENSLTGLQRLRHCFWGERLGDRYELDP